MEHARVKILVIDIGGTSVKIGLSEAKEPIRIPSGPELTPARMLEEWRTSRDAISDILGAPCVTASIPGGDISRQVLESAARAGVQYLFTSEPWISPRVVNGCRVLGRFCPKVGTSPARIRDLAQFRGWTSALVVRRLKGLVRAGLPQLYRHYVRRTTRPRAPEGTD